MKHRSIRVALFFTILSLVGILTTMFVFLLATSARTALLLLLVVLLPVVLLVATIRTLRDARFRRFISARKWYICAVLITCATMWVALAVRSRDVAERYATQFVSQLRDEDRLFLVPLPPKSPDIRVPLMQFVFNPFRQQVRVQVMHVESGWIDLVIDLDDVELLDGRVALQIN